MIQLEPNLATIGVVQASSNPPTPDSVLSLAGSELARAVYRTANTLLASSPDAEEVTLDVLVSLRKKLRDVGQDNLEAWLPSLPGWLDRAAVGKAKARAKKQKHHSSNLAELGVLAEQLAATETKQVAAATLVREVLAYFPRRHRFVFLLEYGLGHTDADIAELTGLSPAVVARTLTSAAHKLREYATKQPMPKAMLDGMAPGLEDNPLRHYVEVFGRPDEITEARIQRRFEAWLSDDPSDDPHADDHSFHDHSFSGVGMEIGERESEVTAAGRDAVPEVEPEPEPAAIERPRPVVAWAFGSVATLALGVLVGMQYGALKRLDHIDDAIANLQRGGVAEPANEGPVLLEPGAFVELAHNCRVEPAKDATVELLRDDQSGAEFRLTAGSIALHVKPADAARWIVHDGRYDIRTSGARFRVTHTSSVPEVEVFEGEVSVAGGLLGAQGVEVTAATYSLAVAIRARGDVPIAELLPSTEVDPQQLQALASDELYGRALILRASDEADAQALLREIVARGSDDWVSELAFEQLRTLVDPSERPALAVEYAKRFPDGKFAEAFAAILCQEERGRDGAGDCWSEFALTYPNSLFGP